MSGAVRAMVAVGVVAIIVVVLVTLLLVGSSGSRKSGELFERPLPRPHDQGIPSNGSR